MFFIKYLFGLLFALAGLLAHAAVNDVLPGDYFPLAAGTTNVSVYAYDRVQTGPYRRQHKLLNGQLDSSILAVRLAHVWTLGETRMATFAVLPWSQLTLDPAPLAAALGPKANGLGDARLGLTGWVINDPQTAHYLGLTGTLLLPSGDYDSRRVLNVGENRWRFLLAAGWQKDLHPRWLVEVAPEIVFYGDNTDYLGTRLEQRPTYALTTYLRHRLTPTWHLHVGGQINRGGETRVHGVDQHNIANNDRLMAGVTWFLPAGQQLILRLAKDEKIDNGFRLRQEAALRYQINF